MWNPFKPRAQGYSESGASFSRRALKGFPPASASAHEDIDFNNTTLRQRSRMLYMAAPIATSAINTNRTKIVGTGLELKTAINREIIGISEEEAKAWQRNTELEFRMWASKKQNCDALGINNFYGLQQLVLKSWLMSGDTFCFVKRSDPTPLNPYSLRMHVIEADRISTPHTFGSGINVIQNAVVPDGQPGAGRNVFDGVEVDEEGRITAYYVCSKYPTGSVMLDKDVKWTRVEAYGAKTGMPNVLHVMDSERPEQYRGVPYLAQVIEPLLQQRRYTESELMAALVQSFFTAWIETEADTAEFPTNEVGAGEPTSESSEGISTNENEYELGPGTVTVLKKGEKIVFGNPNIPTAGFETFVKTICKQIGSALELPYEVLIKEFDASYSASRGALLEAWEAFKMRREWLTDSFCQPIYEIWLSEAVALGRIKAPGFFTDPKMREAWCSAHWIGPVQGQLDPKKEAQAAITLATHGVKTFEQITREYGSGDFEANAEQLKREVELLRDAGVAYEVFNNEPDEASEI